ncbi:enoyl-CoA hydratase/isomerase family protein [Bounagaea algeriensis]
MSEPEIVLAEQGGLGRITLNRPKAINSLTLTMVREIDAALRQWQSTDHIRRVLIEGAGEKGLCAGGDVRAIHDAARDGDYSTAATFWAEEYRMNALIGNYPKPIIGFMDGICMGGGVGITAHGSHRVVTERSKVGMPEVGIGFVPDVGGTYLLARTPGHLGEHFGLTGVPFSGADAIHAGFADHYVPRSALPGLADALAEAPADEALGKFAEQPPAAQVETDREWIDEAYAASTVSEILERLRARPEQRAREAADAIAEKSPTSLSVTLRAVRSRYGSLAEALRQEYRAAMSSVRSGEFVEGVRATLVDKDRDPRWNPPTLAEVGEDRIASFFAPDPDGELEL